MAEKDLVSKKIEDYNEVFADIYNTLLFREDFLVPERLRSGSTESVYQTDDGGLNSQSRDILKKYLDEACLVISSFGIENQASIDKNMPVRVMGYDVGSYRQQLHDQEESLTPVITIVLNMTEKRWNVAKSIHEMLGIDEIVPPKAAHCKSGSAKLESCEESIHKADEKLAAYVQDYKIHVFDIAYLEDETIEAFTSDFKEIARFFKRKRLGENPLDGETELQHPWEILEFISAFTQDRRYLESVPYLEHIKREGGAVTMCAVADALITEGMQKGILKGRREGKLEGKLEGKVELLYEMNYSISEIAEKLNISEDQVEEILQK